MANPVTELIGADGYLNLKKFFKHPLVKQVVNINLNLPISVLRWLSCALNLSCEMIHDSTDLIFLLIQSKFDNQSLLIFVGFLQPEIVLPIL